jgi:hypothetical protein
MVLRSSARMDPHSPDKNSVTAPTGLHGRSSQSCMSSPDCNLQYIEIQVHDGIQFNDNVCI